MAQHWIDKLGVMCKGAECWLLDLSPLGAWTSYEAFPEMRTANSRTSHRRGSLWKVVEAVGSAFSYLLGGPFTFPPSNGPSVEYLKLGERGFQCGRRISSL